MCDYAEASRLISRDRSRDFFGKNTTNEHFVTSIRPHRTPPISFSCLDKTLPGHYNLVSRSPDSRRDGGATSD